MISLTRAVQAKQRTFMNDPLFQDAAALYKVDRHIIRRMIIPLHLYNIHTHTTDDTSLPLCCKFDRRLFGLAIHDSCALRMFVL